MCLLNDKSSVRKIERQSYLGDITQGREDLPAWTLPSLVSSNGVWEKRGTSVCTFLEDKSEVSTWPHE